MKTIKLFCLMTIFVLAGCSVSSKKGTKPHKEYIKDHNYTPFIIPRKGDGVGTLISFKDGYESLIMEKGKCLSSLKFDTLPVSLPSFSYDLKEKNNIELNGSKVLNGDLNLKAAFESNRVKKVQVTFVDPFEVRIARDDVNDILLEMDNSSVDAKKRCVASITNRQNILVERVLGANKIKYRFLNNRNQVINLDANLLQKINITGKRAQELNMSTSLDINFPVIVGYRAWNIKVVPGLAETEFEFEKLTLENIEAIKEDSE